MYDFHDLYKRLASASDLFEIAEIAFLLWLHTDTPEPQVVNAYGEMISQETSVVNQITKLSSQLYSAYYSGSFMRHLGGIVNKIGKLEDSIKQFVDPTKKLKHKRISRRVNAGDLLLFCIVISVDAACDKNPLALHQLREDMKQRHEALASDSMCCTYPSAKKFLHEDILSELRKSTPKSNSLNSLLKNIKMSPRSSSFSFPRIVDIEDKLNLENGLNIGVSPLATTLYWVAHSPSPIEDVMVKTDDKNQRDTFIPYVDCRDEFIDKYICCLERFIATGAHIAVFPEYCLSDTMLDRIKQYLTTNREIVYESQLVLIIAGTIRRESNDNVLLFIDRDGDTVGEYYKIRPYEDKKMKRRELLVNPGEIISVIDMPQIGHIIPPICIDYIAEEATPKLRAMLDPSIIIICSHNESFELFFDMARTNANQHHAITLYCNHCEGNNEKIANKWLHKTICSFACIPAKTVNWDLDPLFFSKRVQEQCIEHCHQLCCFTMYSIFQNELQTTTHHSFPKIIHEEYELAR